VIATAPARGSRFGGRVEVVARALSQRAALRAPPAEPRRILVAHHLLLGDTLMLSPLLKKLRERHPRADIVMTMAPACVPLYARRPWGVRALPFDPRAPAGALFAEGPFDLAFVPGDNRYGWLAQAMGARWVVAFAGDRPMTKNWPIDAKVPYPRTPAAWGDLVAGLADGPPPAPFQPSEWPAPPAAPFERPRAPYAVLHVGASSPLKRWPAAHWHALATSLAEHGFTPVWSAGRGEEALVAECDPQQRYDSCAGRLDLAQLFHLLAGAALLVAPDTGVAHLGRVTGVPTVALFGPGSALLCGAGRFWRDVPYRAVTIDPFPCRDQTLLFKRNIDWVRRCGRSVSECPAHRCMRAIDVRAVLDAVAELVEARACPEPIR
jgi:ADP-heptose:LPS heptosyltransferase